MRHLSPSILSLNLEDIDKNLDILKNNDIRYIHIDVMDGKFVPNTTNGIEMVKIVKAHHDGNFILDTHLMVEKPETLIDEYKKLGSDILTVHLEACDDIDKTIDMIKAAGMKAGVSIKPKTDVITLDRILSKVDLILIMSVEPGFGGQKFMEDMLMKVSYLKKQKELNKYSYIIEIDGGVNFDNVKSIADDGCDIIVAGTAVFKGDTNNNIKRFKELIG